MQFTAYLKDGTALTIPNSQNRSQSQVQQQLIDLYGEHFDRIEQVITLTNQVYKLLDSGKYQWVGTDAEVEDYISPDNCWPNAEAVVNAMIEEGDAVVITPTPPPTVKRVRRVEPITDELYHWITKSTVA